MSSDDQDDDYASENKEKRLERRKDTAEDFTPHWLIDNILTKLEEYCPDISKCRILDPACGNGNIIVKVLEKQLQTGRTALNCLQGLYGLDIMADNIKEARFRLLSLVRNYEKIEDIHIKTIWGNVRQTEDTLGLDIDENTFIMRSCDNETLTYVYERMNKMQLNKNQKIVRTSIERTFYKNDNRSLGIKNDPQNIFTPWDLAETIVKKLGEYTYIEKGKSILTHNVEVAELLLEQGVEPENITLFSNLEDKRNYAWGILGIQVATADFKEWDMISKFDIIIMNPPYQKPGPKTEGKKLKTEPLWHNFILKSLSLLKPDGFLCSINPPGWRMPSRKFGEVWSQFSDRTMKYLEIHNIQDGISTFGASTRYDWYILHNTKNLNESKTELLDEEGIKSSVYLNNLPLIPNMKLNYILNLVAKTESDKVDFLYDRTTYGSDKENMSDTETGNFIYPCLYLISVSGEKTLWWSNKKECHFGVKKVIWTNGDPVPFVDETGEYGLCQFSYAITDKPEVLPLICAALQTKKFLEVCDCVRISGHTYTKQFMENLRKDFWKEFVNSDGSEK